MVNGQYRLSETLDAYATLSLLSLWRCLDPYPAVSVRCTCPPLPQRQRPHVTRNTFGTRENPARRLPQGALSRGCSHSLMFRLPHALDFQIVPTAVHRLGGQAGYTTHRPRGYPPQDVVALRVCGGI